MAIQKILVLDATSNLPKEYSPIDTSGGSGDAGKPVALNTAGKVDSSMLPTDSTGASLSIATAESVAAGALVNIDSTGKVRNANATDATKPAQAFVLAAVTSPANAAIYFAGQVITGQSGLTEGAPCYLGTTAGTIVQTAPSSAGNLVQQIGYAMSDTEVLFQPMAGIIKG